MSLPKVFFGRPIWAVFVFVGTVLMLVLFCWLLENPCWLLAKSKIQKKINNPISMANGNSCGPTGILVGPTGKVKNPTKVKNPKVPGPQCA